MGTDAHISQPDEPLQTWISAALKVRDHAYVPYSHYPVGAALVAENGRVYTGVNVENAAYPSSICAERTALVKAVSEGERCFTTLVVATRNGGSPCGQCRQMLFEFAPDLRVIMVTETGAITYDGRLSALLPLGFGPAQLASE
ncbi:MAG: cytidine deaminase [Candidatus Flexifilum sp.]|jgi:cytidine deaminase